jgi:hypothetical protein
MSELIGDMARYLAKRDRDATPLQSSYARSIHIPV